MNAPAPRRGRNALPTLLGLLIVAAFHGCDILGEGAPESARLVMEGSTGHPLQLVTTSDFDVVTRPDGDTRDVTVFSADTTRVAPPFDRRYSLGPRTRIFVLVSSETPSPAPIRVRIYIDDKLRLDRSTRFEGETVEFVFAAAEN
jgi:hypothetical protein